MKRFFSSRIPQRFVSQGNPGEASSDRAGDIVWGQDSHHSALAKYLYFIAIPSHRPNITQSGTSTQWEEGVIWCHFLSSYGEEKDLVNFSPVTGN